MRRWLVRLYPRAWRRRYGAEFTALLEQQSLGPGSLLDIARGALDAHRLARRARRAHVAQARRGEGKEYIVKRGRHPSGCSFCGTSREAARRLIAGPGVCICDDCIALCNEILAQQERMPPAAPPWERRRALRRRTGPWWRRLFGGRHRALLRVSGNRAPA